MYNYELMAKLINNHDAFATFENVVSTSIHLNREVYLGGIDDEIADNIETLIRFWNRYDSEQEKIVKDYVRKPIKIYIDSYGGELVATFTLIDIIKLSKTPVWTVAVGAAYSGGFFTFIAGHKRFAYPHASFLYHEGSTGTSGDAHKFRNFSEFYNKQMKQLKEHTLTFTKLTEEEYQKILKDDYWLTAEEAVEKGVVDEIVKEIID